MDIFLNGNKEQTQCTTLLELVEGKGLDGDSLVVELNYQVIRQPHWQETMLTPGDRIEFLRFVGGG